MILLSGDRLSEIVASAAHYVRHEPVVTITSFRGAGSVLYRDVFRSHYQSFAEEDDRIRSLLGVLDDTWDKTASQKNQARAVKVVELTERLYRANELRKKENLNWRSVAYICLWAFRALGVFLHPAQCGWIVGGEHGRHAGRRGGCPDPGWCYS